MKTVDCAHGSDPHCCPVPSCNPRGAHEPWDREQPDVPWRTLIAEHDGPCLADCGDRIRPGDPIVWRLGAAAHTACRPDLEGAAA